MKLREVLSYATALKPHFFSDDTLTVWVNECEGHIQTEIMKLMPCDVISYSYDENSETELILKPPHSKIYGYYLVAMIDFANGEYQKYENSMKMFNACLEEFAKWFIRTYAEGEAQGDGYYLSAYGLALRHGFSGTEEEWIASLKGEKGDKGDKGDKGEQGEDGIPGKIQDISEGENGEILVDGVSVRCYDDSVLGERIDYLFEKLPTKVSELINDSGYLVEHQDISGKVDKVSGKGLSSNDYTDEEKKKLAGLENYNDTEIKNSIDGINAQMGDIDTALDGILKIQNSLIGGDDV